MKLNECSVAPFVVFSSAHVSALLGLSKGPGIGRQNRPSWLKALLASFVGPVVVERYQTRLSV